MEGIRFRISFPTRVGGPVKYLFVNPKSLLLQPLALFSVEKDIEPLTTGLFHLKISRAEAVCSRSRDVLLICG